MLLAVAGTQSADAQSGSTIYHPGSIVSGDTVLCSGSDSLCTIHNQSKPHINGNISTIEIGAPTNKSISQYMWLCNGDSLAISTDSCYTVNVSTWSVNQTYTITRLSRSCDTCQWHSDNGQFRITISQPSANIVATAETVCKGETTVLMANNNPSYTYNWNNGSTESWIAVKVDSTSSYMVTVTDSSGCIDRDTITITVNPTYDTLLTATICQGESYDFDGEPRTSTGVYTHYGQTINGCDSIVTLTLIVNPTYHIQLNAAICQGESYDFYGTQLDTAGNYVQQFRTVNDCDSIITLTLTVNPTYNNHHSASICQGESYDFYGQILSASGVYEHHLQSINGCDSVITLTLTVDTLPTVTISNDSTFCEGGSVTLSASSNDTGTYNWSTGYQSSTINVSASGTYSVTFTANRSPACSNTATTTVTMLPLPTPFIFGDTTICAGDTTSLTATGGSSYLWNIGDTNQVINVAQSGVYTVTATNSFGCTASTSVTVTVNSLPTVTITGVTSFCPGNSTTLIASGASNYTWNTGATTSTITIYQAGDYTVIGTDVNGCSSTATQTTSINPTYNIQLPDTAICENESVDFYGQQLTTTGIYTHTLQTINGCDSVITLSLTIKTKPTPVIYGDNQICQGESTILTAVGGTQYLWSTGATTSQITDTAGTYTVTVTNDDGCSASASYTVENLSSELLRYNIISKNKSDGTPYMLIYPQAKLKYQWYENGTAIEGENKQYYFPLDRINPSSCYTVSVQPENPEECGIITPCWVNNVTKVAKIDIIPNPSNGNFHVLLPDNTIALRIYSVNGQLLVSQETQDKQKIDISTTLANGLYILKTIFNNGDTQTEKLIINK